MWDSLLGLDLKRLTTQCPAKSGMFGSNVHCDDCADVNCN